MVKAQMNVYISYDIKALIDQRRRKDQKFNISELVEAMLRHYFGANKENQKTIKLSEELEEAKKLQEGVSAKINGLMAKMDEQKDKDMERMKKLKKEQMEQKMMRYRTLRKKVVPDRAFH